MVPVGVTGMCWAGRAPRSPTGGSGGSPLPCWVLAFLQAVDGSAEHQEEGVRRGDADGAWTRAGPILAA